MTFWVFSEAAVAGSASGPRDGIDSMSDSDGSQAGWIRIRNDPGRAGLQSVIYSERQPGAELGGAGDGEHGGADTEQTRDRRGAGVPDCTESVT